MENSVYKQKLVLLEKLIKQGAITLEQALLLLQEDDPAKRRYMTRFTYQLPKSAYIQQDNSTKTG